MNTTLSIPISTELFLELAQFLRSKNDPRDPVAIVSLAVDYWLDNANMNSELLKATDSQGFQWKSLFLPSGTQIRMQYKGTYHYANVEGDEIRYKGQQTTPGSLANTIAGGSRNAWRDLWIKRPGDDEWILADDCRRSGSAAMSGDEVLDDL